MTHLFLLAGFYQRIIFVARPCKILPNKEIQLSNSRMSAHRAGAVDVATYISEAWIGVQMKHVIIRIQTLFWWILDLYRWIKRQFPQ